ncbi:MAG TPA: hypothetical protein VK900_17225 [Anaerolineales bacterium]|nr:hypothetical protein [Anaerolineales bacterium]
MNPKNETLTSVQPSSVETGWTSIWERYNSPIVWLLLVAYLGVVSFLVTVVFPVQFVDRSQAGFFEPQGVIAIGVMGLIGVWLSMRTGFPDAWDATVSNRQRLFIPILAGLVLGSLFLATDLITGLSRLQEEQGIVQSTDVAFPASLIFYPAASIVAEVPYRLLTIPLLLGLVSIFIRGQSARERVFWVLAILTSLIEPLTNNATSQVLAPIALAFVLIQSFGTNLLQAAFFRKYGFVAAILVRAAFYIPFHVIGFFVK